MGPRAPFSEGKKRFSEGKKDIQPLFSREKSGKSRFFRGKNEKNERDLHFFLDKPSELVTLGSFENDKIANH